MKIIYAFKPEVLYARKTLTNILNKVRRAMGYNIILNFKYRDNTLNNLGFYRMDRKICLSIDVDIYLDQKNNYTLSQDEIINRFIDKFRLITNYTGQDQTFIDEEYLVLKFVDPKGIVYEANILFGYDLFGYGAEQISEIDEMVKKFKRGGDWEYFCEYLYELMIENPFINQRIIFKKAVLDIYQELYDVNYYDDWF